jgi:hypothetical protein
MKRNTMPIYLGSYHGRVLAALLCVPTIALANPLADLQTLIYSPAQRQEITRGRMGLAGVQDEPTTRLNGVVHRAAGKGTVWINNQPYREGSAPAGPIRGVDALVEGRQLRVGESVDKASGERTDVLAPGAVRVRSKL